MAKPLVWMQVGVVSIYGTSVDAASHSHHSIQVIWPQGTMLCKINETEIVEPVIIASNVEHQLQISAGWVVLIEPKSNLGQALSTQLAGQSFKIFSLPGMPVMKVPQQHEEVTRLLSPLFKALKLEKQCLFTHEIKAKDKRIQQLLTKLDHCLLGECIKPISWRAAEVASELALSESRFLHLFSEELGIAWRPYLLWRRMLCAVQAIINKCSATEAAHLAGFSDSAHLSRIFRRTFGMTIRQAQILFRKVS